MLHYFNPGHETAVLNDSPYYTPPAIQQKMQRELGFLPSWYAQDGEGVWLENGLDAAYADFLAMHGLLRTRVVCPENLPLHRTWLSNREVALWGISPQSIQLFKNINKQYGLDLDVPEWKPEFRALCSRLSARDCLEYLVGNIPGLSSDIIPEWHTSPETVVARMKEATATRIVKSPYSSSGRGLLWLTPGEPDRASRQLLQGMLNRQSVVSLEKALDKRLDFSMQFYSDGKGGVSYQGLSVFKTDAKGNYQGTLVASQQRVGEEVARYFPSWPEYEPICRKYISGFLSSRYAGLYKGNIGVDMLVYEDGKPSLYPCVEINMRTTMGFLALQLHRYLHDSESLSHFHIEFAPSPHETWKRHLEMQEKYPLETRDGKLLSGYLPLCPVSETNGYRAFLVTSLNER